MAKKGGGKSKSGTGGKSHGKTSKPAHAKKATLAKAQSAAKTKFTAAKKGAENKTFSNGKKMSLLKGNTAQSTGKLIAAFIGANKFTNKVVKSPVHSCPVPSSKQKYPKKCNVLEVEVSCQHGRKVQKGKLQVVPSESGDTIKLTSKTISPCGKHPLWEITGYSTSEHTGNKASFNAQAWRLGKPTWASYVVPHSYTIRSSSCSGQKEVLVEAYPSDKLSIKLNAKKWLSAKEKVDYAIDKVLGMYLKDPKFEVFAGSLNLTAGWEEYGSDHRAFYKYDATVGFNPLIGAKFRVPFGPTAAIPNFLKKYGDVYLFAEFSSGIDINGHWARETPDKAKMFVDVKGSINGKIGASLLLMSPKVVTAEIAGVTGVSVTGKAGDNKDVPTIELQALWEGIRGEVTIEMAWGLVEFKREFNIVDPCPLTKRPWVFEIGSAAEEHQGVQR